MRTSYGIALAIALTVAGPSRAGVTLGFGLGNTQGPQAFQMDPNTPLGDPGNQSAGSLLDPYTTYGLNDWSFGTPITSSGVGGSASNPFNVTQGDRLIIQIQFVDSSPYMFPNTAAGRMFQWGTRLTYTPGVISATRDNDVADHIATTVTVNSGDVSDPFITANGTSQQNINYANNTYSSNSFGLGSIFPSGWITNNGPGPHNYALANFVLSIDGPGNGTLSLSDMDPNYTNWSNITGTPFDSTVFATSLLQTSLYFHATPAPEPSSVVLAGLAASGLVCRWRRQRAAIDSARRSVI